MRAVQRRDRAQEFAAVAEQDTELLKVLIREIGQDAEIDNIIAEYRFVLVESKAP
jgi:hypothetical protein